MGDQLCRVCKRVFASKQALNYHQSGKVCRKESRVKQCPHCLKTFTKREKLLYHLQQACYTKAPNVSDTPEPSTLTCRYCCLVFSQKSSLNRHVASKTCLDNLDKRIKHYSEVLRQRFELDCQSIETRFKSYKKYGYMDMFESNPEIEPVFDVYLTPTAKCVVKLMDALEGMDKLLQDLLVNEKNLYVRQEVTSAFSSYLNDSIALGNTIVSGIIEFIHITLETSHSPVIFIINSPSELFDVLRSAQPQHASSDSFDSFRYSSFLLTRFARPH
jgi:hypothetical protein